MAQRTREQRLVMVTLDSQQLERCAESMKCSAAEFVGFVLGDAIAQELQPDEECAVSLSVDGKAMTIMRSPCDEKVQTR